MPSRPSGLFSLVFLSFCSNTLCFLDRVNISVAAPFIMRDFGWNETQMGCVFSAFFAGYVVFMIPGGVLADRRGAKRVLAAGAAFWSFFTFLTPFFHRIWSMSVCRYLIGTGQGVNFGCINNLIARHVPLSHRAKVQGFTLSGISFGPVVGIPLGTWIIAEWGWPAMFYVFGLLGFVWIVFWIRYIPPDPAASDASSSERPPIPWKPLLTHSSSVGITLSYFCHNYAGYLFLVWLPTYLIEVHGFSLAAMGIGAAIPPLASGIVMNLSGWLSDYLLKKGKSREFSRNLLLCVGMGGSGMVLLGLLWTQNSYLAVLLITLSSASKAVATPAYWTLAVDMAPRHAGVLSSIMNTSGNIAGIVASGLTGWMLTRFSNWDLVILVAAGITILGAAIAVATVRSEEFV